MTTPATDLHVTIPVIAAPMAGGASTPALVITIGHAGGLGFLAAGYKTPQALADQIEAVRAEDVLFGVNLFAPNPVAVDADAFRADAHTIQPEADRYGVTHPTATRSRTTTISPTRSTSSWHNPLRWSASPSAFPTPLSSGHCAKPDHSLR